MEKFFINNKLRQDKRNNYLIKYLYFTQNYTVYFYNNRYFYKISININYLTVEIIFIRKTLYYFFFLIIWL